MSMSDGGTPGTEAVTTNFSGVSLTSSARLEAMPGPEMPGRGRTKLSSRRLFIASRKLTMSPQGSQRVVLTADALLV